MSVIRWSAAGFRPNSSTLRGAKHGWGRTRPCSECFYPTAAFMEPREVESPLFAWSFCSSCRRASRYACTFINMSLYIYIYWCFLLVQNSLQRRQIHFLSYSVGDHSEAAAVPFASAYYTAPVICLHCPHQDSHSQPCSPPQQSHTWHPLHHHAHGDPTTSGHHGRSGQYFKRNL